MWHRALAEVPRELLERLLVVVGVDPAREHEADRDLLRDVQRDRAPFARRVASRSANRDVTKRSSFSNASAFASARTRLMCASVAAQDARYASRRDSMPSCVSSGTSGTNAFLAVDRFGTDGALRITNTPCDSESAKSSRRRPPCAVDATQPRLREEGGGGGAP